MSQSEPLPVVFLPGGITPVQLSYAPLLKELEREIDPLLKDLEVYAADASPAGYSIQVEVEALERAVDAARLDTFHLVGYSGGGAVSLAFVARHPERLRSLALFEPANVPGRWEPDERDDQPVRAADVDSLSGDEMLAQFTRRQLRPGVEPPAAPPGPPPQWMAKRPAGLKAMMLAFETDTTNREDLRLCSFPVYLAYGLLTGEYMVRRMQLLAGLLPDVWIKAYPNTHHFGPPQRTQPARYALDLRQLWARAERPRATAPAEADHTYAA